MSPADQARPTFYEIVLEGHPEHSRGLLLGLLIGSGGEGRVYFSQEEGVTRVSLGEKLKEIVGLHGAVCHVIVDKAVRDLLKRHEKRLASGGGVRVAESRRIRSARFDFSYHAYARRYGREIQELLRALPAGVRLEGGDPTEKVDETATGMEAYSPAHEYEVEGEGTVRGRIDLLIEARRQLTAHPLIKAEPIELELG